MILVEIGVKRRNIVLGILIKCKKCCDFLNLVVDILYIYGVLCYLIFERV